MALNRQTEFGNNSLLKNYKNGFSQSKFDPCIFTTQSTWILVYVDDIELKTKRIDFKEETNSCDFY